MVKDIIDSVKAGFAKDALSRFGKMSDGEVKSLTQNAEALNKAGVNKTLIAALWDPKLPLNFKKELIEKMPPEAQQDAQKYLNSYHKYARRSNSTVKDLNTGAIVGAIGGSGATVAGLASIKSVKDYMNSRSEPQSSVDGVSQKPAQKPAAQEVVEELSE